MILSSANSLKQKYLIIQYSIEILFKYTCAPVSVAMSNITLAFKSRDAYTTPSDKTRRPSASVLLISTVLKLNY